MTELAFVARERELRHLQDMLERALSGQLGVCFIAGEAGAGKTRLTTEFAEAAQKVHDGLLFTVGNCNAHTGIGDPYLPFREVLGQLTGDVDDKLSQGSITSENANRLRQFLRVSGRAIVDLGPDLIDIFVPGAALVNRASRWVAGEKGWRERVVQLRAGKQDKSSLTPASQPGRPGLEQSQIFEQFTRVLVALSREQPLVLVLDDLHWADESSINLLFHLARRIEDARVLVIGTYRPEDVALGRSGGRHPLDSVINEIRRLHGEVLMTLGHASESDGRAFIDALLDTRANRLGEEFRCQLLHHTQGHALFTIELLLGMLARGDLLEEDGVVVATKRLDWHQLPARVEGVIEEKIRRLTPELHELASIAAVEGEVFSAQVIAPLHAMSEREVLQALDRDLDQHYHLVREDRLLRVGRQRLSQYRFRHNLLQHHLYQGLSASRRELLHEDIARVLEQIWAGQTSEIAAQLARHYELAQQPDLAADYYLQLGERAIGMYASADAAALLQHGLELLSPLPEDPENLRRRTRLLLVLGRAQWKLGQAPESMATFQDAAHSARLLQSGELLAQSALGYDDPRFRFNLPIAPAVRLLEEALSLLPEGDSLLRVQVLCALVRAQGHRMLPLVLKTLIDQAIAMARRLGQPMAVYSALLTKTQALTQPELIRERLAIREEILVCAADSPDKATLIDALEFRMDDLLAVGDITDIDRDLTRIAELVAEIREPFYDYCLDTKRAMRALLAGRFAEAQQHAESGLARSSGMLFNNAEGVFGMQMFSIKRLTGGLRALAPVIAHFVATHSHAASWRPGLALVYAEIGDAEKAHAEFQLLAANDFAAIPRDALWQTCLSYMADICHFLNDQEQAPRLYRLLEPYSNLAIVVGNSITCNGAATRSLGQLATVMGDWERAEAHFRHALEFNEKLQALPWLVMTRLQFARMLLRRAGDGDAAQAHALAAQALELATALGMQGAVQDASALFGETSAG